MINIESFVIILISAIISAILTFVITKKFYSKNRLDISEKDLEELKSRDSENNVRLEFLNKELERIGDENNDLKAKFDDLKLEFDSKNRDITKLQSDLNYSDNNLVKITNEKQDLNNKFEVLKAKFDDIDKQSSVLDEKNKILEKKINEKEQENFENLKKLENLKENFNEKNSLNIVLQKENQNLKQKNGEIEKENLEKLQKLQKDLETKFENLANKIFEEKTSKFKNDSEKSIIDILNPVKEQFKSFEQKISESFTGQVREQTSLKEQLKQVIDLNSQMKVQTESLTKALKSDVKTQGNWGEVILEKILEDSGLRKDIDYVLQGTGLGLKDENTGNSKKPDVIVNLPENKHIIVDAKVSLSDYEKYWASEDLELRKKHTKSFTNSIKNHIKNLEEKKYQYDDKLGTPDFVLMFMPIEGAYAMAVQNDPELHSYAWDKKVAIVGPSTLFATLKTIASIWKIESQNKNTLEIAKEGGKLYDKFVGFLDDFEKLGVSINRVSSLYEESFKKLSTGKGNLIRNAERMKVLGAKTSKNINEKFLQGDTNDIIEDNLIDYQNQVKENSINEEENKNLQQKNYQDIENKTKIA